MSFSQNSAIIANFANNTAKEIEDIVWEKDVSYLEAALIWCEAKGFAVEDLGDILKRHEPIRALLEVEAEKLNFLKKKSRLPI